MNVHALVLMAAGPADAPEELQQEHEAFIDTLDAAHRVVLGGGLRPTAGPYVGGYVLSCATLEEARDIAGTDPLMRAGAMRCDVVEWELVGVNPAAVDRSSLLYP